MASSDLPILQEQIKTGKADKKFNNNKWWEASTLEVYNRVYPYVTRLRNEQTYRRSQNVRYAKLYQNQSISGYGQFDQNISSGVTKNTMTYNVIKSTIDTATSRIAKQRPRAFFLTEDGDSQQQKRAKLLTQYMDGVFDEMDLYAKGARAVKDANIIGLGAVKFFEDPIAGKIKCERVIADEIVVDDNEAMYGTPGQMHQVKYVFRDVLAELYPDQKQAIDDAQPAFDNVASDPEARELITVVESWKLPSTPKSTDGRHAITISSATLFAEEYKKDHFPFVFFRWTEKMTGFWGMGIAEELYGLQLEINKLLRTIQLSMHYMAVPRVLIHAASKVNTASLNNKVGSMVKYSGPEPKFIVPQAMSSEVYNHVKWLIGTGPEQVGLSQLSVSGKKPAGLDSGVALREFQDIETERFAMVAQSYERFYTDAAKIIVDLSKDMYTSDDKPVKFAGKDFLKKIKWKDVSMDEDKYTTRIFPTNLLSTVPAAKLQQAQELFQAGIISKEAFTKLMDMPDMKSVLDPVTASEDLIQHMLDEIIEHGKYVPPAPGLNLKRAFQVSQMRHLEQTRAGLDPERLGLILRWQRKVEELDKASQPVEPIAPGLDPLAVPEAAPVSDLVPQAAAVPPVI